MARVRLVDTVSLELADPAGGPPITIDLRLRDEGRVETVET